MRTMLVVLGLLLSVSAAPRPAVVFQAGGPTERRTGSITIGMEYPLWLPATKAGGVAVDSRNNVHEASWRRLASGVDEILYTQSHYDSRKATGLSTPLVIATRTLGPGVIYHNEGGILLAPSLSVGTVVDSLDRLHLFWINQNATAKTADLYHIRRDTADWSAITRLTSLGSDQYYDQYVAKAGPAGSVHVVGRMYSSRSPATWNLMYTLVGSGTQIVETSPTRDYGSLSFPATFAVAPSGAVTVHVQPTYTRTGTFGSWGGRVNTGYWEPRDMAYDSVGNLHRVWDNLYQLNNGTRQSVPESWLPSLAIDSRDQIYIVGKRNFDGNNTYSMTLQARLRNPDPAVVNPAWTPSRFQEKWDSPYGVRGAKAFISRDDRIHIGGEHGYSRTQDFGLGTTRASTAVFPGASVNVATGNLHFALPLFGSSGQGPSYGCTLYYNSLEQVSGLTAPGWRLNSEIYLIDHQRSQQPNQANSSPTGYPTIEAITIYLPDGRPVVFTWNPNIRNPNGTWGHLVAAQEFGFMGKLERVTVGSFTTEYKLVHKDGTIWWFNDAGKLRRIEDTTGNYLDQIYDAKGRLVEVEDMLGNGGVGRVTRFEYEAADDVGIFAARVNRITDPMGRIYTLTYTGNSLTKVTFNSGPGLPTWNFDYAPANNYTLGEKIGFLRKITPPAEGTWICRYLPDGRLSKVEDPAAPYLLDSDGDAVAAASRVATTTLRYDETLPEGAFRETWLTDRRGFRTRFKVEPTRSLIHEAFDETALAGTAGVQSSKWFYDGYGNVTKSVGRWGDTFQFTYEIPWSTGLVDTLKKVERYNQVTGMDDATDYEYQTEYQPLYSHFRLKTQTTYATPTTGMGPTARVTTYAYNTAGQLTSITHPTVTLPNGSAQTGAVQTFTYGGGRKQLTRATNEEGHFIDVTAFDSLHGLPTSILRQGGTQATTTSYDALGNLLQTQEPRGGAGNELPGPTIFVRDGLYRVTSATDPKGKITQYGYNARSRLTSVTPPVGTATTTTYDARGCTSGGSGPDGTWSQALDACENVRRMKTVRGFTSNFNFDFMGRLTESRVPGASTVVGGGSGGPAIHRTQYAHDGFDTTNARVLTTTEVGAPASRVTKTRFDTRGRTVSVTLPDNITRRDYDYNEHDQLIATTLSDAFLQDVQLSFHDERGRLYATRRQDEVYGTAPTSSQTHWTVYNKAGEVVQTIDPLGSPSDSGKTHKVTYVRDVRGRASQVIDGYGTVVQETTYGDDDRPLQVKAPNPATKGTDLVVAATYTYTSRKELKSSLDLNGKGRTFVYGDLPGQVVSETDALGRVTQTTYDPLTQLPKDVIEASGTPGQRKTSYVWQNGFLTQTIVPDPATTGATVAYRQYFDQAGRMERSEAPLVSAEQYSFTDFSQLGKFQAGMNTITHTYDSLGRQTKSVSSGAYAKTVTRTFNAKGQLLSVNDGSLEHKVSYDWWKSTPAFETFKVAGSTWKIQTYTTNVAGQITEFVDPEGKAHAWTRDANNRVVDVQYLGKSVSSVEYTPGGLPSKEHLKNAAGGVIATTTHLYDSLGRTTRAVTSRSSSGEVLTDFGWSYDNAGQIASLDARHLVAAFSFGLDERGQVKTETTGGNNNGNNAPPYTNVIGAASSKPESLPGPEGTARPRALLAVPSRSASYVYDPSGVRKSATVNGVATTYAYNAANQLLTESSPGKTVTHQYDTWGNLAKEITATSTATTTKVYGYNYLNRLASYTDSATGANWQYDFWPSGERYKKTNLASTVKELYVPRGSDVTTEYAQTGTGTISLKNSYVQGLGIDSKQVRISSANARRHYVGNQVGTTSMMLDDAGAASETIIRDAWGQVVSGTSAERFGFAQRESDTESGLVYMRHRMYDPRTGRFTQTDPIVSNRPDEHYRYGRNNPLCFTDPTGEMYWYHLIGALGERAAERAFTALGWQLIAKVASTTTAGFDLVFLEKTAEGTALRIVENKAYGAAKSLSGKALSAVAQNYAANMARLLDQVAKSNLNAAVKQQLMSAIDRGAVKTIITNFYGSAVKVGTVVPKEIAQRMVVMSAEEVMTQVSARSGASAASSILGSAAKWTLKGFGMAASTGLWFLFMDSDVAAAEIDPYKDMYDALNQMISRGYTNLPKTEKRRPGDNTDGIEIEVGKLSESEFADLISIVRSMLIFEREERDRLIEDLRQERRQLNDSD